MEDLTLKLGLLMETAQSQQQLAATALARLREHTEGLDAVVREAVSCALLEELSALADDTRRAAQALRGLQRSASARLLAWSAALAVGAAALPLGLAWWLLPSPGEIAALRATRAELTGDLARLSAQGGRVELRHCGAAQRLCVRVERSAPVYGDAADFRVLKGY